MLHLYIGYLFIQLFAIVELFSKASISMVAVFFSLIVFIIWSSLPILGYLLAKYCGAKEAGSRFKLTLLGSLIALIENGLFYVEVLSKEKTGLAIVVVFVLFFLSAFIPLDRVSLFRRNIAD